MRHWLDITTPRRSDRRIVHPVIAASVVASMAFGAVFGCRRLENQAVRPVRIGAAASVATVVESVLASPTPRVDRSDMTPSPRTTVQSAGSGVIVAQARQGAPLDVVVLGDPAWMDLLERDGLVIPGSRCGIIGNEAVMVVRHEADIDRRTDGVRWVTADPATAPLGAAARRGWLALGWTEDALARVRLVEDAAAACRLLHRGEADAAVLYATDASRLAGDWTVRAFPDHADARVRYEAAVLRDSDPAWKVLARLRDDAAIAVWQDAGFVIEGAWPPDAGSGDEP